MCGIIAYLGPKDVVPVLLDGLKKLEYRGYDSAGIAVVDRGAIKIRRVQGKIAALDDKLHKSPLSGEYGLGHTRWATHGRPSEENAHPHRDCSGRIVIVHNGIIENYLALKRELRAEGHVFRTETDTEVIAHLLEKYYADSLDAAMRAAVARLEGAFAVAAISPRDPGKIVVARNGPPVVLGLGAGEYVVSSDINPILGHTPNVVFLEDGEMASIGPRGVVFADFSGRPVRKTPERLAWNPQMIEKRGFKHFMLKEIFEQPEVVRDTLLGRTSLETGQVRLDEAGLSPQTWKKIRRALILACGTSYHAGLVAKYLFESLARIAVDVEYASEFRSRDAILDKETLVIAVSQSGETADTLAALRTSRDKSAASLAVTNSVKSSIAREADGVLYTHAGPEIGVAATKTFTAQMAALGLVALHLAQVRGTMTAAERTAFIEEFQRIPHKMEKVLRGAGLIEELALRCLPFSQFLYLGRWINFPVALEGALKLKEISYIHAEAYPGGEMKHGPIALIDKDMPTLAIVPKDRVYEKMLSNIAEIKARAGYVIAVAQDEDPAIRDVVDAVLTVPAAPPLLMPFLTAIPLQLFAYDIAAKRGADVDQPRNLAKSVTVE